jgi:hypothetical protein
VRLVGEQARMFERYFNSMQGQIALLPRYVEEKVQKDESGRLDRRIAWRTASSECGELARRLHRASPLVIDYFLGKNADLQPIGKLLIAWVILQCEERYLGEPGNHNLRLQDPEIDLTKCHDDWCRFVLHKLTTDCDEPEQLAQNRVTFITFNYDVSLERKLYDGLTAIRFFQKENIDAFFSSDRFLHVYGSVREHPPWSAADDAPGFATFNYPRSPQGGDHWQRAQKLLDIAYDASKRIRTIDPHDKGANDTVLTLAREKLASATCVYVLGYGFDRNNNQRLQLEQSLRVESSLEQRYKYKSIMFTNYQDRNQVNKRASKLFFNSFDRMLSNQPAIVGDPRGPYFVEKSVRDVYGALELDFDDLEAQPLSFASV